MTEFTEIPMLDLAFGRRWGHVRPGVSVARAYGETGFMSSTTAWIHR